MVKTNTAKKAVSGIKSTFRSLRYHNFRMLLITQILAMIQALVLALLVYTGAIKIWHIVVLSGLLGCVNAFDSPTRQSLVVQMVDNKADLGNAIALNSSMSCRI